MNFKSQKFIVTKIRKPKSVYISELQIEVHDVLQISVDLNLNLAIVNVSKNISRQYDKSALKRIFETTGCIEFIEVKPQQLIENQQAKQPTLSL